MERPWETEKWPISEGEQQPGVMLSPDDKLRLARMLDEVGVPQLEVGMPAVSPEEKENIRAIANAGLKVKLQAEKNKAPVSDEDFKKMVGEVLRE